MSILDLLNTLFLYVLIQTIIFKDKWSAETKDPLSLPVSFIWAVVIYLLGKSV